MHDTERLIGLLGDFSSLKIAVIGDFVADFFLLGQTKRVSREAPVLVLEHQEEKRFLGGAANAINNIRALGAKPIPIGVVGDDDAGHQILKRFEEMNIDTTHVVCDAAEATTTKQRILGSGLHTTFQQIVRIDRGTRTPVKCETRDALIHSLDSLSGNVDAIVVSDYDYGVITNEVIKRLNEISDQTSLKVLIDSRYRLGRFNKPFAVTPNEPEAQEATGIDVRDEDDLIEVGREIIRMTESKTVLITRGKKGMALFEGDSVKMIPIFGSDEISDVTGAGDTVMAVFSAACCVGASAYEATVLANVAGGLVVMKNGTATVSRQEIIDALRRENPWL